MNLILLDSGSVAGNANADLIVPAGIGAYRICYGQVILTTNATAGSRQFEFAIVDDAETPVAIFDTHAGNVVPANQTVHFELLPGIYRETAIVAGSLQVPIPDPCVVRGGWRIRARLSAAGQAGDTFRMKLVAEPRGSRFA